MATYNDQAHLAETLDSVLAQTYSKVQVIVVDDGSTDETARILAGYGDRLTVIRQENSGGPSSPRNRGIRQAQGEWVAIFDSDDLMLPEKLSRSVDVCRRLPAVDLLFTDFRVIDPGGAVLEESHLSHYSRFRAFLQETEVPGCHLLSGLDLQRELARANFVGTSSVMVRRQALLEAGGFDETLLKSEDIDLWYRLACAGATFAFLDTPLHLYRRRPESISRGGSPRTGSTVRMLQKNLQSARDPQVRGIFRERLHLALVTHGYCLRKEGRYEEAFRAYRAAAAMGYNLLVLKGLIHAGLLRWWTPRPARTGLDDR